MVGTKDPLEDVTETPVDDTSLVCPRFCGGEIRD